MDIVNYNFGQGVADIGLVLTSIDEKALRDFAKIRSAEEVLSDKSRNPGAQAIDAAAADALFKAGSNTAWFEIKGVGLTYAQTASGLVVTGGTITEITYRNDLGQVIATVSGFPPIDAVNFFNVIGGTDSTAAYELLSNLNDGDSTITGTDVTNAVVAGTGNDVASMGGGNDRIVKFDPGNLTYDGGDGSDTLSFKAEVGVDFPNPFVQQLIVDLGTGTGQNPYGGTLTLTSVENIIGTSAADIITGSDEANIIGDAIVESAGDIIDAKGGDDIVGFFSFAGFVPSLTGATVDGGSGTDTLILQYDREGNVLDLSNQANNAGMFRDSVFSNFERFVVGGDFSTSFGSLVFRGDDAGNDLSVRQGILTIDMRGGDDTLRLLNATTSDPVSFDGGAGTDRLVFEANGGTTVLDLANQANNTGAFANGTVANFEIFELGPVLPGSNLAGFRLDFRGDGAASTVIGGAHDDIFRGGAGNDTLMGGGGGDLYLFAAGDGNDTITEDGLATTNGQAGANETDRLRLENLNPADVALTRSGNDLLVTLDSTGETIRITDHFLGGAKGIEQIEFAGTTFTRQDIIDNLVGGSPNASPTVGAILTSTGAEDSGVQIIDLLAGAADGNGNTLHVANVNGLAPGITLVGDTLRIDRSDPAFQNANGGGNKVFQVTYDIVDGQGGSVGQRAQVFVTGVNDAAVIGGERTGSVTEDGTLSTHGFLAISDPDVNTINGVSEARFQLQAPIQTTYGTFSLVHQSGAWVYTLDNTNAAVQALNAGQTLTDTIVVKAFDGTESTVVITINGTNDGGGGGNTPPTVTGAVLDSASEDSGLKVVDLLAGASDGDSDPLHVANVSALPAGVALVGDTLEIATGNAAFQSLAAGAQQVINVSYDIVDGQGGSVAQTAAVTITGVNDAAQIGGQAAGAVEEDGTLTASGTLTVADVDTGQSAFQTQSGAHTTYGTFSIDSTGAWTYSLDNANADVQALAAGQTLIDTIAVAALDGTASSVAITITGADEPGGNANPTVAGPVTANVAEDSGLKVIDLLAGASDSDGDTLHVANAGALPPGVAIDGDTLRVDTGDAAFQSLAAGETRQIVESYDIVDGHGGSVSQTATISITGVNDAAQIGGQGSGAVTEDGTLAASGTLSVSDPDHDESAFTAQSGTKTAYGAFNLDETGGWTYALDNANADVQALNAGETLTDTIAVASVDGTVSNVVITINGANEPGTNVITGTNSANFLNGTAGDDIIDALGGGDFVQARGGNDTVFGGTGDDFLWGQGGADDLHGDAGRDWLFGGAGNDRLAGGAGNDWLFGDRGNDTIDGGAGNDWLFGGAGGDTFKFGAGSGNDVIADFQASGPSHDVIQVSKDIFADWTALEAHLSNGAAGAVITFDSGQTATILGVSKAELVANQVDDFQFV